MKVKKESEKVGLKLSIQKAKIMASSPSILWQIDGETVEMIAEFIFWGSKITANGDCGHEIKTHLLLGRKVITNLYSILYKKDLHDPDNHDVVNTHLEPDILECKVKWALESITMNKASGVDGIPVELFQILKDDSVKVLYSISQQIWKTQQWPQDWKRSVFIPIPKKGNAREYSNYCTIALISHASKVMLKLFQARLQQCMNHELPDVQAGFRKGRGARDQIANICWIIEKSREFQKNI